MQIDNVNSKAAAESVDKLIMNIEEAKTAQEPPTRWNIWHSKHKAAVKRQKIGFRTRVALFFTLYCLILLLYMFSFFLGNNIGLVMEDVSNTCIGTVFAFAANAVSTLSGHGGISAETLAKLFSAGPVGIATFGAFIAWVLVIVISSIWSFKKTKTIKEDNKGKVMFE